MSEILFTDNKGNCPNLSNAYDRQFTARGLTITAVVRLLKKEGNIIATLEIVNGKNMIRLGGIEKVKEAIEKRGKEKNYDLLISEGESMVLVV